MEQDTPAITCNIRGCPNEFGLSDPAHLLYVCTADDIQCKAWLAVIPKVSLRDVGERLCVCSLHFEDGVNVSGDIVPTIFPPVPVAVSITSDLPQPSASRAGQPAGVGPAIRIKQEPVDDYDQAAQPSSDMEDSEHFDSPAAFENDESSMEVDHAGTGLIPPHAIKRELEDESTEGLTSSSTQETHGDDSAQNGEGGQFLGFLSSYVVKEEIPDDDEDDDGGEIAAPPPSSGCGVALQDDTPSSCAFKIQEFGEIPVDEIKTEDGITPTLLPSTSMRPSTSSVTIKTEPPDYSIVENGISHDQGCQADDVGNPSSVVLMPPGYVSEPSSSVATGSTAFAASSNGVLTGDAGIVISNVQSFSSTSAQQECVAEEVVHCPKCINGDSKAKCDKSTCTSLPTRTVWTQTVEPEKRTVWTQVAQLGDLKMLKHRATQTDPWLERSPRLPKIVRRKRRFEEEDEEDVDKL
ncbi:uncharacterized protein LOC142587793 [Dermacentor variabilis]|uniref:uncharacterized protein LOC142587793 n=1 Tax=Dermacentor variabilis TaxID=34621 RepID=UPI003F5AF49C